MISSNHTTELDKILVKRLWANEECPYFDLIMHENGKVFPLLMVSKDDSGICVMKSDSWTPISEVQNLEDENKLNEGFAAIFSKDFSEMDLRVSCGECFSSGENGFISLSHLSSGDLIWLAFFVESNPFNSICINKELVVAQSTDGRIFSLDLKNPTSVEIVSLS